MAAILVSWPPIKVFVGTLKFIHQAKPLVVYKPWFMPNPHPAQECTMQFGLQFFFGIHSDSLPFYGNVESFVIVLSPPFIH